MNYDMNLIQSWPTANKLTLNIKKTKYMLIGSKFKLSQIHDDFTVKVHNTLDRVAKHKALGVHIDQSLNWRPHISHASKQNISIKDQKFESMVPVNHRGLAQNLKGWEES